MRIFEKEELVEQDQRTSWKFAYEALTHVHSLRLYVFNDAISFPRTCVSLRAYLLPTPQFSSSPVVVCNWKNPVRGDSHTVYVPLPLCLLDHSAPLSATTAGDHIEIKLKLLPFDSSFLDGFSSLGVSDRSSPIRRDGGAKKTEFEMLDEAPFTLTSDAKLLSEMAKTNLSFYCRNCSARLTKEPLRHVHELPSTDWLDLADNWFGNCCCSDGAKSEIRFAQFEQRLVPSKGVCLVGSTVCIVHSYDIKARTNEEDRGSLVENEVSLLQTIGSVKDTEMSHPGSNDIRQLADDAILLTNPAKTLCESSFTGVESCTDHVHSRTCCGEYHGEAQPEGSSTVQRSPVPESGFMCGPRAASSTSSWTPFECHFCSSLIGVTSGSNQGVQLFKCHVSTDQSPGGQSDIFRYHSLERVFCNELFANMEENASYRYIIRGLNSKMPLLQLVLLNHESWNCTGSCIGQLDTFDNRVITGISGTFGAGNDHDSLLGQDSELRVGIRKEEFLPVFLGPVAKVMFRDTRAFSFKELSAVEDWAMKQQADDIYVLESEVKALAETLHKNRELFPVSYPAFQQFNFSFLAR